jgi:hypothetical protein
MWESGRDFQRVWEGWEAGFMAFQAFHTLSFPWPAFVRQCWMNNYATQRKAPTATKRLLDQLSVSALAIWHSLRSRSGRSRSKIR